MINHPVMGAERKSVRSISKRWLCSLVENSAPSQFVAQRVPSGATVLPNPFDDEIFYPPKVEARSYDAVFLGRLVPFKGVDILLKAVAIWRQSRPDVRVAIIGDGPQLERLQQLNSDLGVTENLSFLGELTGDALAQVLRSSKSLVAPSRGEEAFGITVIEGLACACYVVTSGRGGLREAGGDTALHFSADDSRQLAEALEAACNRYGEQGPNIAGLDGVAKYRKHAVAREFLTTLEGMV
nr:glycosyltransferase family 4 protein [Oceanococcus sp. HetDA_MAG_MS8]